MYIQSCLQMASGARVVVIPCVVDVVCAALSPFPCKAILVRVLFCTVSMFYTRRLPVSKANCFMHAPSAHHLAAPFSVLRG